MTVSLGELEQQVMNILWELKQCSARDVLTKLEKDRKLAYTTVMTIMGRLVDKGVLTRKPEGKNYLYQPKVAKEKFVARAVHNIFASTISTLGQEAVTYFVKEIKRLNPRKREELVKMLDE